MKRSDFLKRLGIGLGAVVVAPRVLAEMPAKEEDIPDDIKKELTETFNNAPWEVKFVNNWNPSMEVPEGWRVPSRYELEQLYLLQKDINNQIFLGG